MAEDLGPDRIVAGRLVEGRHHRRPPPAHDHPIGQPEDAVAVIGEQHDVLAAILEEISRLKILAPPRAAGRRAAGPSRRSRSDPAVRGFPGPSRVPPVNATDAKLSDDTTNRRSTSSRKTRLFGIEGDLVPRQSVGRLGFETRQAEELTEHRRDRIGERGRHPNSGETGVIHRIATGAGHGLLRRDRIRLLGHLDLGIEPDRCRPPHRSSRRRG